jgi:hypothetical protein
MLSTFAPLSVKILKISKHQKSGDYKSTGYSEIFNRLVGIIACLTNSLLSFQP